jgi:tetratricopeptide (TPR) repeat protein
MVKVNSPSRSVSRPPGRNNGSRKESEPLPSFAPVLKEFGQTTIGHVALAKSLYLRGRHLEALTALEAALRENPELAQAQLLKGLVLAQRADYEAAAESLDYATRLDDTLPDAWMGLAYVKFELERLEEALNAIVLSLQIDENNANAQLLRGNILAAMERYPEAITAYRQAVKSNPQLSIARYKLAHLLEASGDIDEAIQQAIVALRLNPVSSNTRITLGNLYHRLGRLDEALEEYKAAAKLGQLAPQQALGYEKLGEVLQKMGETSGAIAMFQTAIRLNPKAICSYLHLARVHRDEGRLGEAVEMADAAVKVDSQFPEALALLAELKDLVQRKIPACSCSPGCVAPSMNERAAHAGTNRPSTINSPLADLAQREQPEIGDSTICDVRASDAVESCIADAVDFRLTKPLCLTTTNPEDAQNETAADQVVERFMYVMLVTSRAECPMDKDSELVTPEVDLESLLGPPITIVVFCPVAIGTPSRPDRSTN